MEPVKMIWDSDYDYQIVELTGNTNQIGQPEVKFLSGLLINTTGYIRPDELIEYTDINLNQTMIKYK